MAKMPNKARRILVDETRIGLVIRSRRGGVVRRGRNLSVLRRHVKTTAPRLVSLEQVGECGRLIVLFVSGDVFACRFASYHVLRDWVRRSRYLQGVRLELDGERCGVVEPGNSRLLPVVPRTSQKELP